MIHTVIKKYKVEAISTLSGGSLGAYLGSSIGIVGLGTGIAGTIPIALIGAVIIGGTSHFIKTHSNKSK